MRVKRIKWKEEATREQLREAEGLLREAGATRIHTNYKFEAGDTWTTNIRYA